MLFDTPGTGPPWSLDHRAAFRWSSPCPKWTEPSFWAGGPLSVGENITVLYLLLREVAKDPMGGSDFHDSEIHGGTVWREPTTAVCSLEAVPALQCSQCKAVLSTNTPGYRDSWDRCRGRVFDDGHIARLLAWDPEVKSLGAVRVHHRSAVFARAGRSVANAWIECPPNGRGTYCSRRVAFCRMHIQFQNPLLEFSLSQHSLGRLSKLVASE